MCLLLKPELIFAHRQTLRLPSDQNQSCSAVLLYSQNGNSKKRNLLALSHLGSPGVVLSGFWPESCARRGMLSPGPNSHGESRSGSLPLFRQEALVAQAKTHGEILLIRPFSLMFLTGLLATSVVAGLAFLFAAGYEETQQVAARQLTNTPAKAVFEVPASSSQLQLGSAIAMKWQSCGTQARRFTARVIDLSRRSSATKSLNTTGDDSKVQVTVALPAEFSTSGDPTGVLDAEIPRGRQPFLHWLFFSGQSMHR